MNVLNKGKNILITGASSGIGFYTAKSLLSLGANLLLIGRDETKLKNTENYFNQKFPKSKITFYCCDLSNQNKILDLALKIKQDYNYIDVLINNAACTNSKLTFSKEGIEMQFAVNHLAPFLLTHYLLPLLKKSEQGRIINVNSRAHSRGTMHFNDIFLRKNYSLSKAYNQSKLANMMFTNFLSHSLQHTNITVNTFHPGLVNTSFGNKNVSVLHSNIWNLMKILGRSPKKACEDAVYLALDDNLKQLTGKYFHNKKIILPSLDSLDKQQQKKLWDISLELVKLSDAAYGID